jgi:hypothetical protein
LSSSRAWLSRSGRSANRRVTLRFVLSRPGVVEFVVIRVAPDCREVGRFRVAGHAGVNRVTFRGRLRGRTLPPGSYRLRARALPTRRALAETRLVIFRRKPVPAELAAAQASNRCRASEPAAAGPRTGSAPGPSRNAGVIEVKHAESLQVGPARGRSIRAGALGAQFSRATDAVKRIHPLLYALLGVAIALLAVAAVPVRYVPNARIAALLAYRRNAVVIAGATALAAVSVVYVLG